MANKPTVRIVIAAHKEFPMPTDPMYLPIHVGAKGKQSIGYQRDDEGDNISELNPKFCELTALYWAWKNLDADYIGLTHYRRHFTSSWKNQLSRKEPLKYVLSENEAQKYLKNYDILLPKKQHYIIETVRSHYEHTHGIHDLNITENVLSTLYPDYVRDFEKVTGRRAAHMFNLLIMRKDILDRYCNWLFPIMFEMEKQVDLEGRSSFEQRFFGRMAEILLNVWLEHEYRTGQLNPLKTKSIYWMPMGSYNFWKKLHAFLRAKYRGVKYEKSF